jgi:hypothetical protein
LRQGLKNEEKGPPAERRDSQRPDLLRVEVTYPPEAWDDEPQNQIAKTCVETFEYFSRISIHEWDIGFDRNGLPLPQATTQERVDLPAIRNAIAVVRHLLQLFRLELQDPNPRRKPRRLSQRLLALSHVLDHIAQE